MPSGMDDFKSILKVTEGDIKEVREIYGKTESEIKRDVAIIKEWLTKQPHLPQDDDDDRIERFLLGNKFRIEKTKSKIDSCYTTRGIHRDIFGEMDPLSEIINNLRKSCYVAPSPILTPRKERVVMWRLREDTHLFSLYSAVVYLALLLEIQQDVDYPIGIRIIYDCAGFGLSAFKTFNIGVLNKYFLINRVGFTGRLAGMHFVNSPSFMGALLEMMKFACGPKEFAKIQIHDDLESLHKIIPKECLTKELGGELNYAEIHDQVGEALLKNRDLILRQVERVAKEGLRVGDVVKNDQFGVEGTFKTLNID